MTEQNFNFNGFAPDCKTAGEVRSSAFYDKSVLDIEPSDIRRTDMVHYLSQLKLVLANPMLYFTKDYYRGKTEYDEAKFGNMILPEFNKYWDDKVKVKLNEVAKSGPTFLSQTMAERISQSLSANSSAFEEIAWDYCTTIFLGLGRNKLQPLARPNDKQIEIVQKGMIARGVKEYAHLFGYLEGITDRKGLDDLEAMQGHMLTQLFLVFYSAVLARPEFGLLPRFSDRRHLDKTRALYDEQLLTNIALGRLPFAEGRLMQLVFEMDDHDTKTKVDPYNFKMVPLGTMIEPIASSSKASKDIYKHFHERIPVDYKELLRSGLMYCPVQIDKNRIGFFNEAGDLLQLYDTSNANPEDPDSVTPIELLDVINKVFPNYSDQQKREVQDLFKETGCTLDVRLAIEEALNERLDEFSLEDQILIVQLINRATSQQIKEVQKSDISVLVNIARSLEFGDDFADRLLNIYEHLKSGQAQEICANINHIRASSEQVAERFANLGMPGLDKAVRMAWIKRVTELLAILDDPVITEDEVKRVDAALAILVYVTETISQGLESQAALLNHEVDHSSIKMPNGLTITLRPEVTSSSSTQRIGFGVKVPASLMPEELGPDRSRRLSIRLDYDEYGLALDIGSNPKATLVNSSEVSKFIGAILATGEQKLLGRSEHGYHVREAFKDLAMTSMQFKEIVKLFGQQYLS